MFIGEMGCWLVVGAIRLYNRRFGRSRSTAPSEAALLAGGYEPLDGDGDSNDPPPYEDPDGDSPSTLDPPAKSEVDTRIKLKGLKVFMLAAPACCDITGTTLMNIGFLFVAASIYQMTRGALVLFVGLFSVMFLHRKLHLYQWFSLFVVVLGVALVGLAGALFKDHREPVEVGSEIVSHLVRGVSAAAKSADPVQVVFGVLCIAGAQIFTASQFVLEEWILENYALEPLKVVGWEGIFGTTVTFIGMIILHLAIGRTDSGRYGYFDAAEGFRNMMNVPAVAKSSLLIMISIGYVVFTSFYSPFGVWISARLTRVLFPGVLTSSVSALPEQCLLLPVAPLIRPAHSLSGWCRLDSDGKASSGCRLSDSPCLSMARSSLTESSLRL
jgi:drug/metabolite transporter (DMT)-like permease